MSWASLSSSAFLRSSRILASSAAWGWCIDIVGVLDCRGGNNNLDLSINSLSNHVSASPSFVGVPTQNVGEYYELNPCSHKW
jgi:hypothetical protein